MRAFIILVLLGLPMSLWAQSGQYKRAKPAAKEAAKKSSGEKVDIKNLEEQYWTPQDKEFKVVQNRKYSKEGKLGLTAQFGITSDDPYAESFGNLTFVGSYYFTEFTGLELTYTMFDAEPSEFVRTYQESVGGGTTPNYALADNYIGVNFNWIPIYGKMSVLDNKIIYFDLAISPGIGLTTYEPQTQSGAVDSESAFTISLDVQQHFFFTEGWAVRLDMKNRFYDEDRFNYLNDNSAGSSSRIITMWQLGLTYYFDAFKFGKSKKKKDEKKK